MSRSVLARPLTVAASAITLLVGTTACQPQDTDAASEPVPIPGSQLNEVLSGNTLATPASEETQWAVHYTSDGREFGVFGDDSDQGRWRIHNNQLCSDWDTWGNEERCFALFRSRSGEILGYNEGAHEWTALVELGDSRNLVRTD